MYKGFFPISASFRP